MKKRVHVGEPRGWQAAAQDAFLTARQRTWLTTATPGAGKTFYALSTARKLWEQGIITRLYIVAPTDHLRVQWVEAAAKHGFDLRTVGNDEKLPADADGAVVTYAQVALYPEMHAARVRTRPTMAVLDEVHHAGDAKSWGSGVTDAFEPALIRFLLTGTPFRSDDAKIAHVRYEPVGDGSEQSMADYTYGYAEALRDGVVRPVLFATYAADATWQTSAGDVQRAMLGDPTLTQDAEDAAWRTALDPAGEWIPHVFAAAWNRVTDLRRGSIPDAKVIIPASNQQLARDYAQVWRQVTGDEPILVLSDDAESSAKIATFRDTPEQVCVVCVRMVTEGVDIPSAAVLTWTTTASTVMFFRQMVGRVIRARNRTERATVFLPAVSKLVALATDMERERDHVIVPAGPAPGEIDALPEERPEITPDPDAGGWKPLAASALFTDVFLGGHDELMGLPGLLTAEQEKALLSRRDAENRQAARAAAAAKAKADEEAEQARLDDLRRHGLRTPAPAASANDPAPVGEPDRLRREIADLVRAAVARTGQSHPEVWSTLYRREPGPKNAEATVPLLRRRLAAAAKL